MIRTIRFAGCGTTGVPLLLVHGFPLDHRMWCGQLDGLGDIARVVALDLPGFGGTPPDSDDGTATRMDAFADHVLALADALGFSTFVVGGLSMGGYVALAVARRRPERLSGLLLFDTRAEPDSDEARPAREELAIRVLAQGVEGLVDEFSARLLAPRTLAERPHVVRAIGEMIRSASAVGVAAASRGMALRPDARPHLAAIRVPTLVVGGEEDRVTPPETIEKLAAAIPGAECLIVPGAGHLAPLEEPRLVNAGLRRFLARL